jgi:hypothetical protein
MADWRSLATGCSKISNNVFADAALKFDSICLYRQTPLFRLICRASAALMTFFNSLLEVKHDKKTALEGHPQRSSRNSDPQGCGVSDLSITGR